MPPDADVYLGAASRRTHGFVRNELEVPFHKGLWTLVGDASESDGTIGSMISKTYMSMRSGDPNTVYECFGGAQASFRSAEVPSAITRSKRSGWGDDDAFEGQISSTSTAHNGKRQSKARD